MKAILNPDGTFRGLVSDDTQTDASRTREWVTTEPPTPNAGFAVAEGPPTVTETQATQTWVQVPIPLVSKTKLQISDRMTEAEFDGVEALMDSLLASEDAGQRRMAKRWHRAIDIDPNDPETAAGLAALVGMGVITTPLYVIFAA